MITSEIFEAYLKCPSKCWFRFHGEEAAGSTYSQWMGKQNHWYQEEALKRIVKDSGGDYYTFSPTQPLNIKTAKWKLSVDFVVRKENLEAHVPAVERLSSHGKPVKLVPIRFEFANKLTKVEKLTLAFDALVLSGAFRHEIVCGKIVHGDDFSRTKVKLHSLTREVRKLNGKIATLLSNSAPPDIILNRHCQECDYHAKCRQKAIEKDDLSLLAGMHEKEQSKYNKKGIFTVTQLSYTFRPRRRPKRQRDKREKYHHSLKALAIREKKIHIVGRPELKIEGTPIYLDVEGLPDQDSYYLIGMRIKTATGTIQHSLWADERDAEGKIWLDFLGVLAQIENPILIHYGSFESTFIKRMCERYGEPFSDSAMVSTIKSTVNLLSVVYSQIYFPTFSNGLKEIAGYLGFIWSDAVASGLQTIAWRHEWEVTKSPDIKAALLTYNVEDCEALEIVTSKIIELHQSFSEGETASSDTVVRTDKMKRDHPYGFKRNTFSLPELDAINKAAYWDYQRERVYLKTKPRAQVFLSRPPSRSRTPLPPNKTITYPRPRSCPRCESVKFFIHGKASRRVLDLRFMRHGLKRWIVVHQFYRYKCQSCGATFYTKERLCTRSKFGGGIGAYSLYLNIGLRLPQESVDHSLNKLFGFDLAIGTAGRFKEKAAIFYKDSYNDMIKRLCSGQLLHADETKISVGGKESFVWVFANMEDVAYIYSETRQGDILQNLLKNFTGVLVSDFYAAYDAIQCPQQKCLIHLIRDLNDAVLKSPYDDELKTLVKSFAGLVKPIIETVDRYGLKSRFLRKHRVSVDRFYRRLSREDLHSEAAIGFKKRFEKNKDKLFTFLTHDGIPWNNNNAEHAIKAFAMLRNIISGVTSEKGIQDYLVMLSICETCKYSGVDFLDFLRSGMKDIHVFAESKRKRRRDKVSLPMRNYGRTGISPSKTMRHQSSEEIEGFYRKLLLCQESHQSQVVGELNIDSLFPIIAGYQVYSASVSIRIHL